MKQKWAKLLMVCTICIGVVYLLVKGIELLKH